MAAALPSTERGRETRARIVRAAAELVAEKGALAVSLDDVGARAPASRSQLYHYFDSKADLIRTVIDATADAVVGAQANLIAQFDTWAGVRRWMDALVELQVSRQARGGCPLGSLAGQLAERDPHARAALADGLTRWENQLQTGLTSLQARSRLRDDADPVQLANTTMALIQGGLLLTQVRRDPEQLQNALDAAWQLLRAKAA